MLKKAKKGSVEEVLGTVDVIRGGLRDHRVRLQDTCLMECFSTHRNPRPPRKARLDAPHFPNHRLDARIPRRPHSPTQSTARRPRPPRLHVLFLFTPGLCFSNPIPIQAPFSSIHQTGFRHRSRRHARWCPRRWSGSAKVPGREIR
jgi:hypothetical protein